MRIIVAPDSYKGSISALGVAEAMERGIKKVFAQAEVLKLPIADGGEGTVEALVSATGGRFFRKDVTGPLGEPVSALWGVLGDGKTAVIEMASASGLPLVPPDKRNPCLTTTLGTGQLVKEVLDQGLPHLILGIGGSATNDGGAGFASALGIRFLDADGKELPFGGKALSRLACIDTSGVTRAWTIFPLPWPATWTIPCADRAGLRPFSARKKGPARIPSPCWTTPCAITASKPAPSPAARSWTVPGPEQPADLGRPCSFSPGRSSSPA